MQRRHFLHALQAAGLCAAGTLPAFAQGFPARPLRLVVPFAPGGPTDAFARLLSEGLGKQLGQTVVVDNKAGASGAIGSLEVKTSPADGHTLLFGTASTHALYDLIERNPRYSSSEDFDYIAAVGGAPVAFAVAPAMPATLKGVLDAARQQPGKLNYGSPGSGTLLHVATERLLMQAGVTVTHVPYKGSGPAMQDLMAGSIEMAVGTLGGMLPLHKSGRMRLVGVATAKRLPLAPDIPTVAEAAGFDQPFEALLWHVVAVPRHTPAALRQTLAQAVQRAMQDPAMLSNLSTQGMFADLHVGDSAATAFVKAEAAKWQPVVAKLGDQLNR